MRLAAWAGMSEARKAMASTASSQMKTAVVLKAKSRLVWKMVCPIRAETGRATT